MLSFQQIKAVGGISILLLGGGAYLFHEKIGIVFTKLRDRLPFLARRKIPVSVNYHFTRVCNAECGFCFHTAKSSYRAPLEDAKLGLLMLKRAGMRKMNFAGGEPFMYPKFLGELLEFCRDELQLESISIVTNGTKVTEKFLEKYGRCIDILAVSCDSFDAKTNIEIGRGKDGGNREQLFRIAEWCHEYGIKFKLNTVVCKLNYHEDMVDTVEQLGPFRWKCFQVLMVEGENDSEKTLRDVRKFQITDEQYEEFCDRHKHLKCFVPESNKVMAGSYLILDEFLRFLDKADGIETASDSILEVGVQKALEQVRWDEESFEKRGGVYDWSKEVAAGCGEGLDKALEF
ncbi:radical SAM enzyme [Rhizodiscina lignyota]|uniref:Radical SAM enzyme n=1 Tax=Rhizodiscina lignyota TaxID=1504668 RepID=A0A9P4I9H7_9PEZI|nr:radical SAM enzyme [Rhizodiscina lignyota]